MCIVFCFSVSVCNGDAVSSLGVAGIGDLHKVKKWIGEWMCDLHSPPPSPSLFSPPRSLPEESHLDPNDPRNYALLQLVEVWY